MVMMSLPSLPRHRQSGGSMLSSVSKMLERVGEGMAMAVSIAAGDRSLLELEEKVILLISTVH